MPSSGTALVTPSTWNFANQINPLTFQGVRTRIGSTNTPRLQATGTTSPTARAMFRWVIGPLAGQTIDGTVKGQNMGLESNAGANATLALAIKIIQPNGTDRSVLLAQTAADATTTPPEFPTTVLTNRRFQNASEVAAIPLVSRVATAGDYLVIEVGFRSATTTTRNISLRYGDELGTDLAENDTATTDANVWIEFSDDIILLHTATITETIGAATGAVSAQHVATFTAAIAETVGAATASVSASHTVPVYTAAIAETIGAATGAATVSFAAGTFAATIAGTAGAATASALAAFGGTRTATVAGTAAPATASVAARFVEYAEGLFTQWHFGIFGRRYVSFISPPTTHDITILPTAGAATASAFATHVTPTYTASIAATAGVATTLVRIRDVAYVPGIWSQWHFGIFGSRYGDFQLAGTYTATISATAGAATASVSGAFSAGVKTASVTGAMGAASASASAAFSGGVHTAAIAETIGAATGAVSAQFSGGAKIATVTGAMGAATAAVGATFAPGTHTANISASISGISASLTATFLGLPAAAIAAMVSPATAAVLVQFTPFPTTYEVGARSFRVLDRPGRFRVIDRPTRFEVLSGN